MLDLVPRPNETLFLAVADSVAVVMNHLSCRLSEGLNLFSYTINDNQQWDDCL
jgi:hypothetical protein